MAAPFEYTPSAYYPTPYVEQGYAPAAHNSPFIPPADLYPSSPYSPPSPLPDTGFASSGYVRERRPSFHATTTPYVPAPPYGASPYAPASPYAGPSSIYAPAAPYAASGSPYVSPYVSPHVSPNGSPNAAYLGLPPTTMHQRRRSFGDYFRHPFSTSSPWMPTADLQSNTPITTQIHPLLNGEQGNTMLNLNLATNRFEPYRLMFAAGDMAILTHEEASQPATYPPVYRMRIKIDRQPQWPVELQYNYRMSPSLGVDAIPPQVPISLGDVLIMIHRSMQTPISHLDWGRLTSSETAAVTRAYARRVAGNPSEAALGVKRVDYLLDRYMFRGLVRTKGEHGWETFKLVL